MSIKTEIFFRKIIICVSDMNRIADQAKTAGYRGVRHTKHQEVYSSAPTDHPYPQ